MGAFVYMWRVKIGLWHFNYFIQILSSDAAAACWSSVDEIKNKDIKIPQMK